MIVTNSMYLFIMHIIFAIVFQKKVKINFLSKFLRSLESDAYMSSFYNKNILSSIRVGFYIFIYYRMSVISAIANMCAWRPWRYMSFALASYDSHHICAMHI